MYKGLQLTFSSHTRKPDSSAGQIPLFRITSHYLTPHIEYRLYQNSRLSDFFQNTVSTQKKITSLKTKKVKIKTVKSSIKSIRFPISNNILLSISCRIIQRAHTQLLHVISHLTRVAGASVLRHYVNEKQLNSCLLISYDQIG